MKKEDMVIYGCVIAGAGIGLVFDAAIPGCLSDSVWGTC